MSFPFQGTYGLIRVEVEMRGPSRNVTTALVLDTGSTETVISSELAERLGFDLTAPKASIRLRTASSVVEAHQFLLPEIVAMGQQRVNMSVTVYDMPPTTGSEGV